MHITESLGQSFCSFCLNSLVIAKQSRDKFLLTRDFTIRAKFGFYICNMNYIVSLLHETPVGYKLKLLFATELFNPRSV